MYISISSLVHAKRSKNTLNTKEFQLFAEKADFSEYINKKYFSRMLKQSNFVFWAQSLKPFFFSLLPG